MNKMNKMNYFVHNRLDGGYLMGNAELDSIYDVMKVISHGKLGISKENLQKECARNKKMVIYLDDEKNIFIEIVDNEKTLYREITRVQREFLMKAGKLNN